MILIQISVLHLSYENSISIILHHSRNRIVNFSKKNDSRILILTGFHEPSKYQDSPLSFLREITMILSLLWEQLSVEILHTLTMSVEKRQEVSWILRSHMRLLWYLEFSLVILRNRSSLVLVHTLLLQDSIFL